MSDVSQVEPARLGRQPWSSRDLIVLGALAGIGVVAVGIGFAGATRVQPIAGLALLLALGYCLSTARRAIDYPTLGWGLALQFIFALIVLKTEAGRATFQTLGGVINRVLDFAFVGSSFVFGPLGSKEVWPKIMTAVLGEEGVRYGVIFAFQVLPT
ncbi:MAG: Na+ dependent nucleoside transporter N-terminal domain-containing protein, partial [Steroidobacteraceae bacterium]